jgi:16S rRNA (adenine1518-N6/adenine1519-N6)-dimethyltransferase
MSRQKLGQHFLVHDAILERLAIATCGQHTARVVEIGPGRGALTRHLLPRTDELHVVELDRALVAYLERKFVTETRLAIHQGDVLETDLSQWGPAALAGNLPYYITSPIIEKFVRMDARFPVAMFLVQWEVAERLLANPGSRSYGYLTVATRLVCDVELISKVPGSAFSPPPKVDSGALLLRRKAQTSVQLDQLLRFIGRCFLHKRKTLRNNLRGIYGDQADSMPEARLRAEQLSLEQFVDLFQRLSGLYTEVRKP